jgi:hypothetical protein
MVDAKALFSNIDATSLDQVSVDQNGLIPEATPTVVVIDEAKEQQEREEIEKVRQKIINKTDRKNYFVLLNRNERQHNYTCTLRYCTPILELITNVTLLITMLN